MQQRCIDSCAHVELSNVDLDIATEAENNIRKQKGDMNPTTLPLSKRRDFIGALAQNGLTTYLQNHYVDGGVEFSPYFSLDRHHDEWDFRYRGSTFDVKGSQMRPPFLRVTPGTFFLIDGHQRRKVVGYYVFVKVDVENMKLHIAGYIDYDKFWSMAEKATGQWVRGDAYLVRAKDLTPIERILA